MIKRGFKSFYFRTSRLFQKRLVQRAINPYATHLPVLIALGKMLNVQHVLELGCGEYSTLTFLNSSVFPHLQKLHSVENDRTWADKILSLANRDKRLELICIEGSIDKAISLSLVQNKDLILIDDSVSAVERSETIKQVCNYANKSVVVVIHDFETKSYRDSAKGFAKSFRFMAFNPNTGVLWNNSNLSKQKLSQINNFFTKNHNLELTNQALWLEKIDFFLNAGAK